MILFRDVPAKPDVMMVGVIAQIITISLMALQVLILVMAKRSMYIKGDQQVLPLAAAAAISLLPMVSFFLVK